MNKGKVKVLYIITGLTIGGAEILLLNLIKSINRDIFDCSVLYLKNKSELNEEFSKIDVKIYNNAKYSFFNPCKYYEIYKIIKGNNIDILHTHLVHSNLIGRIIGSLAGAKCIINSEHNTSNWQKKNFLLINFYKYTLKYVDIIHCISNSVKYKVNEFIGGEKLKVIYNGIDIEDFQSKEQKELKDRLLLQQSYPIIGCVSRLDRRKGIEYLIKAVKILKEDYVNIKLLLVGDGPERERLSRLVIEFDLTKQVIFTGKIAEVQKYLQLFDLFILPSLQEGLSIAIIEAMASGVPVIASEVDGIPEVITNNSDGILIPPENESEIAYAAKRILEDRNLMNKLVNNAYTKVRNRFDIKKVAIKFQELYLESIK